MVEKACECDNNNERKRSNEENDDRKIEEAMESRRGRLPVKAFTYGTREEIASRRERDDERLREKANSTRESANEKRDEEERKI